MINTIRLENRIEDLESSIVETMQYEVLSKPEFGDSIEENVLYYSVILKNLAHKISIAQQLVKQLDMAANELQYIVKELLEDNNIEKAESADITVKLKRNPPKVLINDEMTINEQYYYEKRTLDKYLISKHIKEGIEVPGCELVQDYSLDIKYKPVKVKDHV